MLFTRKVLLDGLKTMVLFNVIDHPREVIVVFAWLAPCPRINVHWEVEQECMQHFLVTKLSNMVNTVSNHFIGFVKDISDTKMCAMSMPTKNKIIVMCKHD